MLKRSPELCVFDSRVAVPELSEARGMSHVTVVLPDPGGEARGMVTSVSSGQSSTGGSVSTEYVKVYD